MTEPNATKESHFVWLDPGAFPGRLIVPRSDRSKYEHPADLLFDTVEEANAWRDEELEFQASEPDEQAYVSRWVLCRRTVDTNLNPLWDDNLIQFARLLREILATQDHLNIAALADSMDLTGADVDELFERAHYVWEQAKDNEPEESDVTPSALVVGNPFDGLRVIGPVTPNTVELDQFIERDLKHEYSWWLVDLQPLDEAIQERRA